jgi:hypothetical protein
MTLGRGNAQPQPAPGKFAVGLRTCPFGGTVGGTTPDSALVVLHSPYRGLRVTEAVRTRCVATDDAFDASFDRIVRRTTSSIELRGVVVREVTTRVTI